MPKLKFSTFELPAEFDDRARFSTWHDLCVEHYCSLQLKRPDDRPFWVQFAAAQYGAARLGHFQGTISDVSRLTKHVAADGSDDFFLGFSRRGRMRFHQHGREAQVAPGSAVLLSDTEAGGWRTEGENEWVAVTLSRKQLLSMVARAEDLLAMPLADGPAMRHLRSYLELLIQGRDLGSDPALDAHVGTTLVDLVALALGADPNVAEVAKGRGLRTARLQKILCEIRTSYANASFSAGQLACKLGLSERYIQDLLHDTGSTLGERVLELRLQLARSMLESPRYDALRIIDIALQAGFDDVSNFNRCFRRHFGMTPTHMRDRSAKL